MYDDGYRVRRHSYADVTRAARGFAATLIAHGVSKDDKVLLWGENRPEWIACYWGILLAGAVPVPEPELATTSTEARHVAQA